MESDIQLWLLQQCRDQDLRREMEQTRRARVVRPTAPRSKPSLWSALAMRLRTWRRLSVPIPGLPHLELPVESAYDSVPMPVTD